MRALFSVRALLIASTLFIIYATTIPWDLAGAPTLARVAWVPLWDFARGRPPSIPDLVQNVVLFMPFGFLLGLALPLAREKSPVMCGIAVASFGLVLSGLVEGLQTMSLTRTPSASDLLTNVFGAFVGGVASRLYARHLAHRIEASLTRIVREQPGIVVFVAYAFAVTAGSLAPFVPTLDLGELRANVRTFLDNPWGPKPIGALVTDGLLFMALAFLAAYELPAVLARYGLLSRAKDRIPVAFAVFFAAFSMSALAALLEMLQVVLVGHSPGVQDVISGTVAALLGAALASIVETEGPHPAKKLGALTRRLPWLVITFSVLAPTLRALQPFQWASLSEKIETFTVWNLVPFWGLFRNVTLATVRNVFEVSAFYVPLGYSLHVLGRRPRAIFFFALALAEALEVLQIAIEGRTYDVTEGIYAGLFAVVGAWIFSRLRMREERHDTALLPLRPS